MKTAPDVSYFNILNLCASLCNEHTYQPYIVSVNYCGNCLYDENTARSICKLADDF